MKPAYKEANLLKLSISATRTVTICLLLVELLGDVYVHSLCPSVRISSVSRGWVSQCRSVFIHSGLLHCLLLKLDAPAIHVRHRLNILNGSVVCNYLTLGQAPVHLSSRWRTHSALPPCCKTHIIPVRMQPPHLQLNLHGPGESNKYSMLFLIFKCSTNPRETSRVCHKFVVMAATLRGRWMTVRSGHGEENESSVEDIYSSSPFRAVSTKRDGVHEVYVSTVTDACTHTHTRTLSSRKH